MAKKFVDAAISTEKVSYTLGDGTSLTLTNGVRLLYDDTLEKAALYTLITRIRDAINEGTIPAA